MSQDTFADVMNQLMNAKRSKANIVVTEKSSKLLMKVLEIMKQQGYLTYELDDKKLKVTLKEINECRAIKPRFTVNKKNLDKYVRRFLPAKDFGFIIISTSKGLKTHIEAKEAKIGGSLIAYFY